MMAKYRIGLFASSLSLVEHLEKLPQANDSKITIAYETLDDAVPVGCRMEKNGIEVIVSRRGTAEMLREHLDIPVLSIPTSSLDIFNSLKDATTIGRKVMLPVFTKKLIDLDVISDLLNIELVQAVYDDISSLRAIIELACRQGCEVIVGGSASAAIARELGLHSVEIKTSEDVLADTLENAKSTARSRREEQKKSYRYQCIIDASSDGIIAVDQNARITALNQIAGQLLGDQPGNVVGESIHQYIPTTPITTTMQSKIPIHDHIVNIKNETFVFNHTPMIIDSEVIGGVSSFKDISKVMRSENKIRKSLARGLVAKYHINDLIHKDALMQDVVLKTCQFAPTDSTLLLTGSTGTGKEILAHSIHNLSARSKGPFVSLNCAALPEQLLESELFGYEEGAFTGSKKGGKPGLFEIAHQGTIFLDEISATPMNVQVRLLRILQEKEVMRVGGDRLIPIDVRVVAAANEDLAGAVQEGVFREDLYFRLNVLQIHIPPLCQRSEDIPILIQEFINRAATRHSQKPICVPSNEMERLQKYPWPGNVRQLQNFTERLVLLCGSRFDSKIFESLVFEMTRYSPSCQFDEVPSNTEPLIETLRRKNRSDETDFLHQALSEARFCKTKAAKKLGISRTTLWRKLKQAGINV